ncbi:histidine kinase [Bowmanella sp. Y26]|uniref:sensor histidine kinase n=1 Tax=Bowmanella yangjiangensis TaxID=2811230 RepID=UPI001BDC80FE|nr:ATP-binding protein [Bowmanella yangjiangensis]MBT1062466.1 histidine kinase [Bowmanella yangjiangensis]
MVFNRFSLLLSARITLIVLLALSNAWLLAASGYHATQILLLLLLIFGVWETVKFVGKTNAELKRFLDAVRYSEFTQRFDYQRFGSGFEQLGEAFTVLMQRFLQEREHQEQQLRHFKAMVEHTPIPLLSLHSDGRLSQWNNSARRLFGSAQVCKLDDLTPFGLELAEQWRKLQPGQRQLCSFDADGMPQQLLVFATEIILAGQREKLLSVLDIGSELDAAQLQAWQDLVRVLTHEIMNSITPVASLAATAAELSEDLSNKVSAPSIKQELGDIRDSIATVARRSDSLMQFVSSYRRLTRLPSPNRQPLEIAALFAQLTQMACQAWPEKGLTLHVHVEPEDLKVNADPHMLEQVLLNLLKNAEQALQEQNNGQVWLNAAANRRGHVVLDVTDNGPGISEAQLDKIFVPFFTTKRDGSGVGLALTRQVMIAHGGQVKATNIPGGGACFTLTF